MRLPIDTIIYRCINQFSCIKIPVTWRSLFLLSLIRFVTAPPYDDDPHYTFRLPTDFTWDKWLNGVGEVPEIPSQLIAAGIPVVINVTPDPLDLSQRGCLLHIYRRDNPRWGIPEASNPSRTSYLPGWPSHRRRRSSASRSQQPQQSQQLQQQSSVADRLGHIVEEGPWKIAPADMLNDGIQLIHVEHPVRWVSELWEGGPIREFFVLRVGPVYYLPEGASGTTWLKGELEGPQGPASVPVTMLAGSGLDFAIHTQLDPTDWITHTVVTHIYNLTPRIPISTSTGPQIVDIEGLDLIRKMLTPGPWRVRASDGGLYISLIRGRNQADWVLRYHDALYGANRTPRERMLRDFLIHSRENPPPSEEEQERVSLTEADQIPFHTATNDIFGYAVIPSSADRPEAVAVRIHQMQCMKLSLGHFANQLIVEEGYIKGAGRVHIYPGGFEVLNESVELEALLPQKIEVRLNRKDKVIARSVLTDHLDFHFDVPVDEKEKSRLKLVFCALAGLVGLDMRVSKRSTYS